MTHQISEELISAYLDGELTSDEQLLVEEALRDNPQSQQLLEDLQSLHDHLQSIPRSEPSQDYTEQILRRAERTILTGTSEPSSDPLTEQIPAAPTATLPTAKTSPGNWKHVIWASTALAATLLLALLFRPEQPISHQLTDATQPQANGITTEQADPTSADNNDEDEGHSESQLFANKTAEFEEAADGAAAGLMTKGGPGEATQPKKKSIATFGEAAPGSGNLQPVTNAKSPEELFLFVNLTQKEFDRQTVVRTLLQQQVPFDYDPTSSSKLPVIAANRNNRGLAAEVDELTASEEEKVTALNNPKRNQGDAKEEGQADGTGSAPARTAANTRVVTIEASPEELEQLVASLSNQYQVDLEVEKYAASGFSQQARMRRQLDSPGNRKAVERIQALATQNNLRRASAARAPAGKAADKPTAADNAESLQSLPATIPPGVNSAKRDKQQAEEVGDSLDDTIAGGLQQQKPQQQKANTLRVVVVIEANEITAPAIAARKASPPAKKKSLKGWELYTWQKDGVTYYSLMLGTNRVKTAKEISDASVKGTAAIQAKLAQLQKGELVLVHGRDLNTKASAVITKQITEYCKKIGLKTP